MKTKFALLICTILIFIFTGSAQATPRLHVIVSGKDVTDKYTPLMMKGVVFVPKDSFNATPVLKFGYLSGSIDNLLIYESNDKTAYFTVGNVDVKTVSNIIKAKNPPFIKNKVAYVPLRLVAETFGCTVHWDHKKKTVYMSKNEQK